MKHPITINASKSYNTATFMAQYLSTTAGRMALASSMIAPLRTTLDYQSIGRKAFPMEPLQTGALPCYNRRFNDKIIKIGGNGKAYNTRSHGQRIFGKKVTVPQFEIFSNPTINIEEIKSRRFSIINRSIQKARQELMSQEDSMTFAALDRAAESVVTPEPAVKKLENQK